MNNAQEKAKELIKLPKSYYKDIKYSPIYLFTTENITGMLNNINIANKRILTVSASGDHIFNMLLKGAQDIDTFDINYLAKYYYYFKESAIKTLTYNEFLNFFFPKRFNNKVFAKEVFLKIITNINDLEALKFWKTLFLEYTSQELYLSNLFIEDNSKKNTYKECNLYLKNETNYKRLQTILKNYNYKFIWLDIFGNLSNIQTEKYDFIYLSNIFDKLTASSEEEYSLKIKEIIGTLTNNLTPDGILGISYLYLYLDDYWSAFNINTLSNISIRQKYFQNDYTCLNFNGFNTPKNSLPQNQDGLMIKRKLKKKE